MIIALCIFVVWVVFALFWGWLVLKWDRYNYDRQLTWAEVDIIGDAARDWCKTGKIDDRHIDELEALGHCAPGYWRKIAGEMP